MASSAITAFVATAILLPLSAGATHRQPELADGAAQRFQHAVDVYVDLHRRAERSLPPLQPSEHWDQIARAVDARAAAIRAARPMARPGDLFDSQVAELIRGHLRAVLNRRGTSAGELSMDIDEEGSADAARPVVNERFPWARGAMMPPDFLQVLPALPEELQYRIVDRDLILIDMHADLVVDILADALPAPSTR